MIKIALIALTSLIIGLAIGLFVLPMQADKYLSDSAIETLSDTVLNNDYGTFSLTTTIIWHLDDNEQSEALETLNLARLSHAKSLVREYEGVSKEWQSKIDKLFTSYIEQQQSKCKFNPSSNEVDKLIVNHVKKYNKSLNQDALKPGAC